MLVVEKLKIQARIKKKIKICPKPTKQRSLVVKFYCISFQIHFLYMHMHFKKQNEDHMVCGFFF